MPRLHITQDETGYWQLSKEDDDGTLTLIAHQFRSPDHLIEDARELVEDGKVPGAVILLGPPQTPTVSPAADIGPAKDYQTPAPRKAVE